MALRLFVAYFIFTSGLVAGETVYALKGKEFNFKPHITGPPENILWKHDGNKVVEFGGKEQQAYSTYKNRIILDWHTAELIISDLSFEDSGDYELEAFKSGGNLETSHFNLVVMDKVAKPTISCKMNNGSIISGTLMCSAEPRHPPSLMKFEWSSSGDVQPGPQLTIKLGEKLDDEVYTCSVSNPLSKETATFTAKDCYPADKSSNVAVIVIPVLLLLFIIIGLAVFCIRKKKACTINGKDLENQLPRGPSEDDENECKEKLINDRPEEGVAVNATDEKKGICDRDPAHNEDANPQQFIGKPEENSPESDSSRCEKRTGPESDGSEHEADDEPKDTAGEHKEKPDSNELDVEAAKENQLPTVPDRSGSETSVHEQDSSFSQEQRHTREESQQETDKSVSGDENQKLPVSTSQQPQSPTPTTSGSGESEEQSDLSTAEADKGTECSEKLLLKGSEHEADDEPKDTAGEHKEKPHLNELDVEAATESDSSPTVPDRSGSETSVHEQDSSLSQEETHTREENQQETDKSVSGDENQKLPVSTSQQPQSPTPTTSGSGESKEQSDLSTAEADKGTECNQKPLKEGYVLDMKNKFEAN